MDKELERMEKMNWKGFTRKDKTVAVVLAGNDIRWGVEYCRE